MNWLMVLLLFNVQTGELSTHTEQLFKSQKDCEETGVHRTADVTYPSGLKANYICLPDQLFFPPEPDKKSGGKKILGIL